MWTLLLALALAATPSAHDAPPRAPTHRLEPKALPNADVVAFAPRLVGMRGVEAFFDHAGETVPLLSPAPFVQKLHPLVRVDPAQPDLLKAAGIDASGPFTKSVRDGLELVCLRLSKPALFGQVADLALSGFGQIHQARLGSAVIRGAGDVPGREAGWVLFQKTACSAKGPNARAVLRQVARWLSAGHWPAVSKLRVSGALRLRWRQVTVGLDASGKTLTVDARLRTPRPLLARSGPAAFPVPPSGLLRASAHLAPRALARQLTFALGQSSARAHRMRRPLEVTLASQLTGQVLLGVDRVELDRGLSSWRRRLSAPRWAAAARVTNPDVLRKALTSQLPPVRKDGKWHFRFHGARVALGLEGRWLWVANDALAKSRLLDAPVSASSAHPRHASEVVIDPAAAGASLGSASLLDALRDARHALWLAIGAQVSNVLGATSALSAWADRAPGGLHLHAHWSLR